MLLLELAMSFLYNRTLANVLSSRSKALICALPWSFTTVDWTRWRHKATAHRGSAPRSCIGPRTCQGRPCWQRLGTCGLYNV